MHTGTTTVESALANWRAQRRLHYRPPFCRAGDRRIALAPSFGVGPPTFPKSSREAAALEKKAWTQPSTT